jgi:F-type H+-transporting ATPase subunit b
LGLILFHRKTTVLIDWFTVSAQIVNFLILVWLLKRFLYRPILAAMDAREQQIAGNLQKATEQKSAAEQERANYLQQRQELEGRKSEILKQARDEAAAERQRLLGDARQEAALQRAAWRAALQNEQEALRGALARKAAHEAYATARCLLEALAGAGLEERMAETFIRRLQALDCAEKGRIEAALHASHSAPILRSAFDLPQPTRTGLEQALHTELGCEERIEFQTAPDLLGGIELIVDGNKVAWSFAACLNDLEQSLNEILETERAADGNA